MKLEMPISRESPGARLSSILQQAGSITAALAEAEARVRKNAGAFDARWQCFQWLCVLGDWPRALRQLQVAVRLAPDFSQSAYVYRDLIRAELLRREVFAGRREPGSLLPVPAWMMRLRDALTQASAGDLAAADASRQLALSEASAPPGMRDEVPFAWIADSDTRLGPTCEIVTAGRYAWLPFSQVRKLELAAPAGLLDLLWRPATVTLSDGVMTRGFMPVRYPGSEHGSDVLRLAYETSWSNVGNTGVIAVGQRTWMTDAGDVAMLDVTSLVLDAAHG